MDDEDLGSMSDRSSDDELCQQLQDAGLLVLGRKRPRKQSFSKVKILRLGKTFLFSLLQLLNIILFF